MEAALAVPVAAVTVAAPPCLWLRNRTWDLVWISLSALLVGLPFAAYEIFQYALGFPSVRDLFGIKPGDVLDVARNAVNALIAIFIGGPHMYATFTRTALDGEFRPQHVPFLLGSLLIPVGVITLGMADFILLITCFFFWASVHIMHQIAYIIDSYNHRNPVPISWTGRALDYVVTFSSLYPLGVWRMVNDDFKIGQLHLYFPEFFKIKNSPILGWGIFLLAFAVFAVSLLLWVARTWGEHRRGALHSPKALLMGLTIVVAFFIPAYHELDVAFQGFNTWHSFQYIGLTLYINQLRQKKQGIATPLIRGLSQEGKGWRFYLFNVGASLGTVLLIALLLVNRSWLGFGFDQCYYLVVLSVLLVHYFHDHMLFTEMEALKA